MDTSSLFPRAYISDDVINIVYGEVFYRTNGDIMLHNYKVVTLRKQPNHYHGGIYTHEESTLTNLGRRLSGELEKQTLAIYEDWTRQRDRLCKTTELLINTAKQLNVV